MAKLPSPLAIAPTRATASSSSSPCIRLSSWTTTSPNPLCPEAHRGPAGQQVRHATYVRRPRRPYTFTQLVQLSDGSSYTMRTTSPQPLYRTGKDTRNTLLWQPSERKLRNVEVDEAGKLAAFRERFGRAFDQQQPQQQQPEDGEADEKAAADAAYEGYGDLISSYASDRSSEMKEATSASQAPGKKRK